MGLDLLVNLKLFVAYTTSLSMISESEKMKQLVGYKAVDDYVKSGMFVGLGTGSTAFHAIERIGQKIQSGELVNMNCIPSSERTRQQALGLGIPLTSLDVTSRLDLSIDGADDVDLKLNLIKGAGGSLLRDKMVYLPVVSDKFICIVDESKLSRSLGSAKGAPLPVEVTPFCCEHTRGLLEKLPSIKKSGGKAILRRGSISNTLQDGPDLAVTDNGNHIVDIFLQSPLEDASQVAKELLETPGVLEHGLFIGVTTALLVACKNGVRLAGSGGEAPWW